MKRLKTGSPKGDWSRLGLSNFLLYAPRPRTKELPEAGPRQDPGSWGSTFSAASTEHVSVRVHNTARYKPRVYAALTGARCYVP